MIVNSDWLKPKIKPYHHQISLDCIKKLVDCVEQFNKDVIDDVQESQLEPERLVKGNNNNMYRIVNIIDGHYIVKTPKGLKKVKIDMKNKKDINDEINIEKL
jgi:hypothetical protein